MLGKRVIKFKRLKIRSNFMYWFSQTLTYTLIEQSEHNFMDK